MGEGAEQSSSIGSVGASGRGQRVAASHRSPSSLSWPFSVACGCGPTWTRRSGLERGGRRSPL